MHVMLCYFKFWDKHKIVNNQRMASIKVSKVNNRRMSSIKMLLKMRLDWQVPDKLFISVFACNRLILFVIISGAIFHKRMASLTQVFWDNSAPGSTHPDQSSFSSVFSKVCHR